MNEHLAYIYREVIRYNAILTCEKMEWMYPTGYKITVLDKVNVGSLRPMCSGGLINAPDSEWYKRTIKKQIMFQANGISDCTTIMKNR